MCAKTSRDIFYPCNEEAIEYKYYYSYDMLMVELFLVHDIQFGAEKCLHESDVKIFSSGNTLPTILFVLL